ncbi:MAG: YjbQ family protein [Actinomycetota bacterium]|nr:YjbQ family protein [Actinomycetota bacterium]
MTSVEIPYSIACALPTLAALDITNEVQQGVRVSGRAQGIAYMSPEDGPSLVRVCERESGFFEDVEALLARVIPTEVEERERLVCALLGPRTEQVPFRTGRLCLGQWQRVLLVSFEGACRDRWALTLVG